MAWLSPLNPHGRDVHGDQSEVPDQDSHTAKKRNRIQTAFAALLSFLIAASASWFILDFKKGFLPREPAMSEDPQSSSRAQRYTSTFHESRPEPRLVSFHALRLPGDFGDTGSVPPVNSVPIEKASVEAEEDPFYVAERKWNPDTQRYAFYRVGMDGTERTTQGGFRRYFLSENQIEYPIPESGCGPTALLNLYIWYLKFGLIKESTIEPDLERYKQRKFREIDQRIHGILGQTRSPERGTNRLEQVLALDELLQAAPDNRVRLHFEFKKPPLDYKDFIRISRNYRAGILTVLPKDPITGEIYGYHAVLAVRGDTSGTITLANWGAFTHGRLVMRPDGQWFIPRNPTEHEMRIVQFTTLIPFTPEG